MEIVRLRTFDHYIPANIVLGRLRDAGVDAFLLDENTVTIDPILSNAIGGIKLAVRKEDEALARQLLDAFDAEYRQNLRCPSCGSDKIIQVPKKNAGNFLTAILTWLFSSYALTAEQVYQCQSCGFESENPPYSPGNEETEET